MPRKNLRFTNHAVKRKLERNITEEQIQQTLDNPDYTISHDGRMVAVKQFSGKIITVVYIEKETFIKIITAY
jgi:hypothetical protein